MDLIFLLGLLILLNAVFAMSEIAVVSSRKVRLQRMVDENRPGAEAALALQSAPSTFLSANLPDNLPRAETPAQPMLT